MTPKINIITAPDKIFSDCLSILFIHPGAELLNELQNKILSTIDQDVNVYHYDKNIYSPEDMDWLLSVFHYSTYCVINLDKADPTLRMMASYFIAKTKTYWLTNSDEPVYNHISNNRVYNLEFLNGGYFGETQ